MDNTNIAQHEKQHKINRTVLMFDVCGLVKINATVSTKETEQQHQVLARHPRVHKPNTQTTKRKN
jgi:hypothetical protein